MSATTLDIVFLNSIEPSVWGGLENWMEIVGLGLAEKRHRIRIAGRRESKFLTRLSKHNEFVIVPLDISGDFNPFTVKALADIVRSKAPDVIICNFVKDVRLAGLTRMLTDHYAIIWTPGVNLAQKSLSHKWLFSDFVDRVIVPSNYLRDKIIASGFINASRFDSVPIGIDETKWRGNRDDGRAFLIERFGLPDDAFICLTSGRFVPQKGHCHLISGAKSLIEKYDNVFFLFLGDGPLEAQLVRQIRELNLTDRFVFCGLMENHAQAVFGADLYVHPAVIEPYGIVLVEAMAARLPIVATRVGGIPEVVEENQTALLVNVADSAQLTNAIERLYTDVSMRESLGKNGRDRYERRFRADVMIDRIEKILIEAAAKA